MAGAAKILTVCGSSRKDGKLERLLVRVSAAARAGGAEVRELYLHETVLPVMVYGDEAQSKLASVQQVRELAAWADGFILGTPEYHGSLSGALKNWFDFLYGELAGKFAGVVASTGGGSGDMSITSVKTCFQWCHGFVLPFHCAAGPDAFTQDELSDARVLERLDRIGHDVARYTPVIRAAFEQARTLEGPAAGIAGT